MEQQFLPQEEPRQRKTERPPESEAAITAQPEAPALIGNRLEPEVVDTLMRKLSKAEGSGSDPRWMEPHEREALLGQLVRQSRVQKRRRRVSQVLYGTGVTLFTGFNLAYLFGAIAYISHLMLPMVIVYSVAGLLVRRAERSWAWATAKLTHFDDVRATGPLLEALDLSDPTVVATAEKALLRLLPRLQASDADTITTAQRESLYRRLVLKHMQTEPEFMITALHALEQVGDVKALACVESLAKSRGKTTNAIRVREAAQQCLVFLQARAEQQEQSASLLRASSGLDTQSNALLRPATGAPPIDSQQLLRAVEPEN